MTCKLIVLDVDGTLVSHDLRISPRVKRAVDHAQDKGIIVTLASGRAYPSMLPYVDELGITAPVISYQGSKAVLPATGEAIYHATLPLSEARRLLEYAQSLDLDISAYVDDRIYLRDERHPEEFYQRWFGLPRVLVDDLIASIQREPTKMLISGEARDNDQLLPELQERFGSTMCIVRTHELFVEAVALGVSKGTALERVAAYLGISQEQTMAIGDSDNDAEMVSWAGLGVAMGNAAAVVKAVADFVVPSVAEDGAAVAIETYGLH